MALQFRRVGQHDALLPVRAAHTDEAGTAARMAGVLEDDQLNGRVDPLGQLIPFVVGEIGVGIVEIHVLQTGDLIAHILLFATFIRYIGPVPGKMKDQDVSCPGTACQPVPLR